MVKETTDAEEPGWGEAPLDSLPATLSFARSLAQQREHVELQGAVLHRSPDLTLAATAATAAAVAIVGQLAPLPGAVVLLLVLLSALIDLDGGQGWVRRLVLVKDIGHTILLWRGARLPPPREAPFYRKRPPTPADAPLHPHPTLLLCIPTDIPAAPSTDLVRGGLLIGGLAGVILSVLGLLLAAWSSLNITTWGALLLIAISALAVGRHLLRPATRPSPALPAALALLDATRQQPLAHLTLAFAFLEGLHAHADPLEILLRNYALILPPEQTRVLILVPDSGPLTARTHEGLRRREADLLLLQAAPERKDARSSSPAARALRLGWRAATLQGDLSDTGALMQLLQRLDHAAGQREW